MRFDDQHASDDHDEYRVDCGDDSNYQPSTFPDDHALLVHRDYAKLLASVGGLIAVVSLAAPLAGLTRVFECSYTGPVYSDGIYLVNGDGERTGENALSEGEEVTVFLEPRPGTERAPTLLVGHAGDACGGATNLEYTMSGYAVYSKVCTHVGCMVSNEDGATLVCPCHFGRLDPIAGAKVVGGPSLRTFPQLPVTLSSEGNLIAAGDFNGLAGPEGE